MLEVSGFAVDNRVLTYWITKGWRKTILVKFSDSPVASTNQFLIEDISQALKVTKCNESTLGMRSKQNNNKGKQWEKSMPMYRGAWGWGRFKRCGRRVIRSMELLCASTRWRPTLWDCTDFQTILSTLTNLPGIAAFTDTGRGRPKAELGRIHFDTCGGRAEPRPPGEKVF